MTIRTGIIGYGLSGRIFHGALLSNLQGYKVTAVATGDPQKQQQVLADFPEATVYSKPQELIEDPEIDLVVISTPNLSHAPLAVSGLLAGKHVVIEKPFTVTVQEAEKLIALAKAQFRIISVYHNRRFDSDFRTVERLLSEGSLGRLVEYESRFDRFRNTFKENAWREKQQPGSGILYDLGPHLIDQALSLFGMPEAVYADILNQRGGEADDAFELILHYSGMRAVLKAGMLVKSPQPRFVLTGTEGSFVKHGLDVQENALKEGLRPMDSSWGTEPEQLWGRRYGVDTTEIIPSELGDYRLYYQNLLEAITIGSPLSVKPEDGLNVIRIIEAAQKSALEGRKVILKNEG